jgi:uncharacterized protein (TIGR02145 family)/LPXTG-motif cell wall-anchored protein
MESITQTINIVIGGDGLANTGSNTTLYVALGAGLIIVAVLFLLRRTRNSHFNVSKLTKNRSLSFRGFGIFFLLALFTASLALSPLISTVSAASTLSLGANQDSLTVTVPEGGGTATTTTTLTSGTTNADGYTLTASLTEAEPGIAIKLKGGDVATSTTLNAGDPALTLKTTDSASSNDTTQVTLDFTIDSTVTPGKKDLKLAYAITDNVSTGPTMQSFTTSDCTALPTYTGANEEAVIELTDSRGGSTQTYQVAKLADGNCWMLTNLKLGSTTSSITLTPSDTNIASNLTLPPLSTATFEDEPDEATINHYYDDPIAFGPVPGDTGSGSTNYGYLYNWSAATGGESRTSHTEEDGDAPYSICPANWKLPTATRIYDEDLEQNVYSGDYPDLDRAFGGTGEGSWSGEPNIAQWQYGGAFKGVFSGYWSGEFVYQGDFGVFWSASAHPDSAGYAFLAYFGADEVGPADNTDRLAGFSVRCLLQ